MTDYKYAAQLNAEQLAEDLGLDFYSLTVEQQCELYERGMRQYVEQHIQAADLMNDVNTANREQ